MGWVSDAILELRRGQPVKVRPIGGSMRGRVESGQLVTLVPVEPSMLRVDDIVLVRWKGSFILHIVKEVGDQRVLIGNNVGKINGWAASDDVIARVSAVED